MYRCGSNQKKVYDWLCSFDVLEKREFDVPDQIRDGIIIPDVMARVYISYLSKREGFRFTTKVEPNSNGLYRLFVTRRG